MTVSRDQKKPGLEISEGRKEAWFFTFREGFEAPVVQIPQLETAFHAPALLSCFRVGFCGLTEIT
jgi:hypothetical protein